MTSLRRTFSAALVALALSVTAIAHDGANNSKDGAYRAGYDYGYTDGLRHGRDDNRAGRGSNSSSSELKAADRGWTNSIGHKGDYKKGYREGYELGYREGYSGRRSAWGADDRFPGRSRDRSRDRYGRTTARQNTAYTMGSERGYTDGVDKGRTDLERNRSYDLNRHDDYDDADNGYRSSYGEKRDYQSGYREGFRSGYEDGFRGTRYSRTTRRPGQRWYDSR